jgi:hypothetical protein
MLINLSQVSTEDFANSIVTCKETIEWDVAKNIMQNEVWEMTKNSDSVKTGLWCF